MPGPVLEYIALPLMALELTLDAISIPAALWNAMTFPAPAVVPPIMLLDEDTEMPTELLAAAVPVLSTPIQLDSIVLPPSPLSVIPLREKFEMINPRIVEPPPVMLSPSAAPAVVPSS